MSSVLVTGGSGYLGQFLVRALAEDGWKVGAAADNCTLLEALARSAAA